MNIKILGTGCKKCNRLYELCKELVDEMSIEASVEKIEDIKEIVGYGVMGTPGLVINEKVLVAGKLPSRKEVKKHIENNL
ncbi:thioredoxin family protein [Sporosalibacterium faouarense]|uniref:thioredoxin family protein n=1 Tax=Sporosalibacterium faouarense TaxID=516123 RepID=UPI00192AA11A|nr:thioredoxin family protein [Sporosalibacterium faouarense]